jgi:hypothetical protein
MAGASGRTVTQKLGIKPGFCIFADGAPIAYDKIVGRLPDNASVQDELKPPVDMVHVFATQAAGLTAKLRRYRKAIAPDGMIWVSWPKKSSGASVAVQKSASLLPRVHHADL